VIRSIACQLHRWIGLAVAGFLVLEGLTGSILAYRDNLEQWISPQLYAAGVAGEVPLDVATLAQRIEEQEPQMRAGYFAVYPHQVVAHMRPRTLAAPLAPEEDEMVEGFFDPWTGNELGKRRPGDLSQGIINLIPFIFELHMSLAPIPLGGHGAFVLGLVALAWTLDCLVSLYLTFPRTRLDFLRRWRPAWAVRRRAGFFRLNFDLHRAGGLWTWLLLLGFAWSSVMFNLPEVYDPVMRPFVDQDVPDQMMAAWREGHYRALPRLGWQEARLRAEAEMDRLARQDGLQLGRAGMFGYLPEVGVYTYGVASSADVQERAWNTGVWIDGDTGALVTYTRATGQNRGYTVFTWLRALHFGDVYGWGGYRLLVCALGILVCLLSGTGIYIWWRKRRARRSGLSLRCSPVPN
jgi:uncharacterized iron-regulated membrane protein